MLARANYCVRLSAKKFVVIEDLGPWDKHETVTLDAVHVCTALYEYLNGRKLLYIDSLGDLSEIVMLQGRFVGFASAFRTRHQQQPAPATSE